MFHDSNGPVSFSCQNPRFQGAWRTAFALCRKTVVASEDGSLGYVWPARRQGVLGQPGAKLWSGARQELCHIDVPTMGWLSAISIGQALVVVRQGRLPVRIHNLNDFPVTIGRYQKLGRLFQVNKTDVHGTRDVSLTPGADRVVEGGLVDVCVRVGTEPTFEASKLAERPDLTEEEQGQLTVLLQK